MISVHHLSKAYGTQLAVQDLSFSVKQGEILGFLGPNGAGKSTTMKMLTGFVPPSSGQAIVAGHDIAEEPLEVRKKVGYLPEHNPLYLDMYVLEFLDFSARIHQLGRQERKRRVAEVIEQTGLGSEQHKQIRQLSKGYRQRVGLSQALLHQPEVLILDEPTTGLDPNQIVDIRLLIREVGKNKTILFSSHILSEVEAISDRVLIIDKGVMLADAPVEELRKASAYANIITLEVMRPGLDLASLAELPDLLIDRHSSTRFSLRGNGEEDLRPRLFELCVAQNNPILELHQEALSLENIFRTLTQQRA